MGRKGHRDRRNDILKKNSLLGECIYIGCGLVIISVAAQVVRPTGVDTDKNNVTYLSGRFGTEYAPDDADKNGQCQN